MWFNKKSGRMPEDKGWEAMRQMLDKELPEKKRKNRLMLWFWPLLFGLGLGYYYTFADARNVDSPATPTNAGSKPETIVQLHTKSEVNSSMEKEILTHEQITASSSAQKKTSAKTTTVASELGKNHNTAFQRNVQRKNTNYPSALTQSAIKETTLPAPSLMVVNPLDEHADEVEPDSDSNVEESRNTWITTLLSEKSIQALSDNSDYQMPVVATISIKSSWASNFKPYIAVGGLMSHDTKDKGYSIALLLS